MSVWDDLARDLAAQSPAGAPAAGLVPDPRLSRGPSTGPARPNWDAIAGDLKSENLTRALQGVDPLMADKAGAAAQLSKATGAPADLLLADPAAAAALEERQRRERVRLEAEALAGRTNELGQWLGQPGKAAVAADDFLTLGKIADTLAGMGSDAIEQYTAGAETMEAGILGAKLLAGQELTEAEAARLAELDGKPQPSSAYPLIGAAANLVGTMVASVVATFEAGAGGAVVGAGVGFATGGPLGVIPGAAAGYTLASRAGMIAYSGSANGGLAYLEFRKIRTEDGALIDDDAARFAAILVGSISGPLESVGLGKVLSKFPVIGRLTGQGARQTLAALLRRPTVAAAFKRFMADYSSGAAAEITTEVLQAGVEFLGQELAKSLDGRGFEAGDLGDAMDAMIGAGLFTAEGMVLAGLPGPSMGFAVDYRAARQAERDVQRWEALGEQAEQSALRERDPAAFGEAVEAAAGGGVQAVHIEAERFGTYFQGVGIDPAEVAAELGVSDQWERAQDQGGDLVIPLRTYAQTIVGTEYHKGLTPDLRTGAGEMSARQAQQWFADLEAEARETVERITAGTETLTGGRAIVFDDVREQLINAGRPPDVAEKEATLFAAFFGAMAARAGQDAAELYRRYRLKIKRELPGELAEMTNEELDAALGRTFRPDAVGAADGVAAPGAAPAGGGMPTRDRTFLGDGSSVEVDYVVVEGSDLATSNLDDLSTNPAYPADLQPRDRTRAASGEQVQRLAGSLVPELLGRSATAADGAPIVGPDGAVESGNGRVLAIRRAYASGLPTGKAYRDWLASQGYQVEGMRQPVLVRRRVTDLSADERVAFTRAANERTTASMSASEQAAADGEALTPDLLSMIRGSDVGAASNRPFVRRFLEKVAGENELGALVDRNGELSIDGRRRVRSALLARAFGDMAVVERLLEEDEGGLGPLGRGLLDIAPLWAALDDPPSTAALMEAVRSVIRTRDQGVPPHFALDQGDMLGGALSEDGAAFLGALIVGNGKGSSRLKGRARIAEKLEAYIEEAGQRSPGFLGDQVATPAQMLEALERRAADGLGALVAELGLDGETVTGAELRAAVETAPAMAEDGQALFQRMPAPEWFSEWLGLERDRIDANIDGLFRKYEKRRGREGPRFDSPEAVRQFIEETIANAHIAIEASSDSAVLVARIGEREQAVVIENKGRQGGVVISAFEPDAGQLDGKIRQIVEDARRRDAIPAMLVSPAAASDPDVRLLVSRWLPLPLDRVQPGAYDASTGRFLGNRRLFQNTPKGADPRGSITFNKRSTILRLFEQADLSTVVHELGHFMLEVMGDLAEAPDAPADIVMDYARILAWLGVGGRSEIKREHHEAFARGLEAFTMEGRAPAPELDSAFARFRAWMVSIYREISRLKVTLTPDMRAVFDRMLASADAIEAQKQALRLDPLWDSAEAAGMTADEYADYLAGVADASTSAENRLISKAMRDVLRERQAAWKEERAKVRQDVAAEVDALPAMRAIQAMSRGLDGGPALRLDVDALRGEYDAATIDALKRRAVPPVMAKGGMHPDLVAPLLGYASGADLVRAVLAMPPRTELIEQETNRRMKERHGDILKDGNIQEEAAAAIAGEETSKVLAAEMLTLGENLREVVLPLKAIRQQAERALMRGKLDGVRNPTQHLMTAQRLAKKALEAIARGDRRAAYDAKRQQVFFFETYRIARRIGEDVEKALGRFGALQKPTIRAKISRDILEQVDQLLERFDFRKSVTDKQRDRRQSLAKWIEEQRALGIDPDVPDHLQREAFRQHYRDMTAEDFMALADAVAALEHVGRLKERLLSNQRQRSFEAAAGEVINATRINVAQRAGALDFTTSGWKKFKEALAGFYASHVKMEFLFDRLDGFQKGPVFDYLFKPFAEAEAAEGDMRRRIVQELGVILGRYSSRERGRWVTRKVHIPELGATFNKSSLLSMALNWGNAGNREALVRGYRWDAATVERVLFRELDARDWETVQAIWDLVNSLWPEIAALETDLVGKAPQKVEAAPVVGSPAGDLRGGYFPLKYDSRISDTVSQREERQAVTELFGGNWSRPATRKGHTKARVGSGGLPVKLDFGVLTEHLMNVTHDLTHRRAVIDVIRLVEHPGVREAIEQTAGRELYRQIKPWIQEIAAPPILPRTGLEKILSRARIGTTIAFMGWKMTTATAQITGILQSVNLVGSARMTKALGWYLSNPATMPRKTREALARSPALRHRRTMFDRDVSHAVRKMTEAGPMSAVHESYFWLIGTLDLLVAVPTWYAGYEKGLKDSNGDVEKAEAFADSAVRMTQSAGGAKDLARIQRGGELARIFVMFYSYFSSTFNLTDRARHQFEWRDPAAWPRLVGTLFPLLVLSPMLAELLAGRGPDEDDDESWAHWMGRTVASYPFAAVVGVRDVAGAINTGYGYSVSAVDTAGEALVKSARTLGNLASGEDLTRSGVKALLTAAGIWGLPFLGQFPSGQLYITGEYLFDVLTGEHEPEGVVDVLKHGALKRRREAWGG